MNRTLFARWRDNFLAGLAVSLPALLTLFIVLWVFGSIANLTDKLLFFLPTGLTHSDEGRGPIYWYWSLVALALAVTLVTFTGLLARYYVGRQMIGWTEGVIMRVPMVNRIYAVIKQVNEAFTSNKNNAFKTVVLVEFPREGLYSVGFVTAEQPADMQAGAGERLVCVFIPTTPNPTSGFLVMVSADKLKKLDMTVPDGLKFIVSLGSVSAHWPVASSPSI
jgi:uncharacterized membrane protein